MSTAVAEKPEIKPKTKFKYKFKLLVGMHTTGRKKDGTERVYRADPKNQVFPIIETDIDLGQPAYNGTHIKHRKFERVYDEKPPEPVDATVRLPGETVQAYLTRMGEAMAALKSTTEATLKSVESMSGEQLKEFAEAEEIDLDGEKNVEKMRQIIRSVLKGK